MGDCIVMNFMLVALIISGKKRYGHFVVHCLFFVSFVGSKAGVAKQKNNNCDFLKSIRAVFHSWRNTKTKTRCSPREVLALAEFKRRCLTSSRKNAKGSSCACIIFALYCRRVSFITRLRVVLLLLGPSSVTRKKCAFTEDH